MIPLSVISTIRPPLSATCSTSLRPILEDHLGRSILVNVGGEVGWKPPGPIRALLDPEGLRWLEGQAMKLPFDPRQACRVFTEVLTESFGRILESFQPPFRAIGTRLEDQTGASILVQERQEWGIPFWLQQALSPEESERLRLAALRLPPDRVAAAAALPAALSSDFQPEVPPVLLDRLRQPVGVSEGNPPYLTSVGKVAIQITPEGLVASPWVLDDVGPQDRELLTRYLRQLPARLTVLRAIQDGLARPPQDLLRLQRPFRLSGHEITDSACRALAVRVGDHWEVARQFLHQNLGSLVPLWWRHHRLHEVSGEALVEWLTSACEAASPAAPDSAPIPPAQTEPPRVPTLKVMKHRYPVGQRPVLRMATLGEFGQNGPVRPPDEAPASPAPAPAEPSGAEPDAPKALLGAAPASLFATLTPPIVTAGDIRRPALEDQKGVPVAYCQRLDGKWLVSDALPPLLTPEGLDWLTRQVARLPFRSDNAALVLTEALSGTPRDRRPHSVLKHVSLPLRPALAKRVMLDDQRGLSVFEWKSGWVIPTWTRAVVGPEGMRYLELVAASLPPEPHAAARLASCRLGHAPDGLLEALRHPIQIVQNRLQQGDRTVVTAHEWGLEFEPWVMEALEEPELLHAYLESLPQDPSALQVIQADMLRPPAELKGLRPPFRFQRGAIVDATGLLFVTQTPSGWESLSEIANVRQGRIALWWRHHRLDELQGQGLAAWLSGVVGEGAPQAEPEVPSRPTTQSPDPLGPPSNPIPPATRIYCHNCQAEHDMETDADHHPCCAGCLSGPIEMLVPRGSRPAPKPPRPPSDESDLDRRPPGLKLPQPEPEPPQTATPSPPMNGPFYISYEDVMDRDGYPVAICAPQPTPVWVPVLRNWHCTPQVVLDWWGRQGFESAEAVLDTLNAHWGAVWNTEVHRDLRRLLPGALVALVEQQPDRLVVKATIDIVEVQVRVEPNGRAWWHEATFPDLEQAVRQIRLVLRDLQQALQEPARLLVGNL